MSIATNYGLPVVVVEDVVVVIVVDSVVVVGSVVVDSVVVKVVVVVSTWQANTSTIPIAIGVSRSSALNTIFTATPRLSTRNTLPIIPLGVTSSCTPNIYKIHNND